MGVLSFSLELDSARFLDALQKSSAAQSNFVIETNLANESLTKFQTGINAASQAAGSLSKIQLPVSDFASVSVDKLGSALNRTTESSVKFKEGAKLAKESTHALELAMSQIGYSVAPAITGNILAAASVLKALNAAALAGSMGIGAISLAAAGASAAFFTWSKGIEAVQAALQATDSAEALEEQMSKKLIPAMLKEVDELISRGRLDPEKGAGLKNMLNSGDTDFQNKARKDVFQLGLQSNAKDTAGFNLNRFRSFTEQFNIQSIANPRKRATAEIDAEMDKLRETLIEKASELHQGGPLLDTALANIDKIRQLKKDDLNKQFQLPEVRIPDAKPNLSSLEKIGFVMGGNNSMNPLREVALQQLSEQKKTNQALAKLVGKDPVDMVNR